MKIKRFVDKDSRGAMAQARSALGPEAVILSNKRVGNQVELVAAIDLDEIARLAEATETGAQTHGANLTVVNSDSALSGLRQEVGNLRSMVEGRMTGAAEAEGPESSHQASPAVTAGENTVSGDALLARLGDLGVSRELSKNILQQLPATSDLEEYWALALDYIAEHVAVMAPDSMVDGGGIVALLGTTGVGKTTTLAKLAARFVLRHGKEQLALVSTDCYRVGGQEQLQAFANYLDVPLFVASDARELRLVLDQVQHKKMVLIDTPGFSQRDPRLAAQLELLISSGYAIDPYLILPATASARAAREVIDALGERALSGAVITKLDEAVELGGPLGVAMEARIPLAYVGTGQKVPEDMIPANTQTLINKALELTSVARPPSLSKTLQDTLTAAINRAST